MRARFVPGSVRIQPGVVRSGRSAAEITLRTGDMQESGDPAGPSLERAELMEIPALWAREDTPYIYSFSLFLPRDFPVLPVRLVIAQWKQFCPARSCTPDNPVLSVRYAGGELFVQQRVGPKSAVLYRTREEVRGRWLDFRFHIRFSRQSNGYIRGWLNRDAIIDRQGISAYQAAGGYTEDNRFYFKMGLYRDQALEPMTIYVDEYSKEEQPR